MSPVNPSPMNPQDKLPPELEGLAAQLRGLTPAPAALNRDRLMFEAGRAAAGRGLAMWRGLAAAALLLAATLGAWAGWQGDRVVERVVYVPAPTPERSPAEKLPEKPVQQGQPVAPPPALAEEGSLWNLRLAVLTHGIDALPPPPPVPISGHLSPRGWAN